MAHHISGAHRTDSGMMDSSSRRVIVERDGDRWYVVAYSGDADRSFPVRAVSAGGSVYLVDGATEREHAMGIGSALDFVVQAGECERVGMPVEALA